MKYSSYKGISFWRMLIYGTAFIVIVCASYCSNGKLRGNIDKECFPCPLPFPFPLPLPEDIIPHPHIPHEDDPDKNWG
jgi:hypothetical protein